MLRIWLVFCFFFVLPGFFFVAAAQEQENEKDGRPDSLIPLFFPDSRFDPYALDFLYLDTSLVMFQRYDFYAGDPLFYADKGNVGHVARKLLFGIDPESRFKVFSEPLYPGYLLALNHEPFFRPRHVYSELYYVTGSEAQQLFSARHNQRFHDYVYGGLTYQVVHSPGFYSRMAARNAGLSLRLDVEPSDRYQFLGSFAVNRIFNQESGGLENYLGFEEESVRDSVFLYHAQSRYRDVGFRLQQSYIPGFQTSGDQSGDSLDVSRFISLGRLEHQMFFLRESYVYHEESDTQPLYFPDETRMYEGFTLDSTLVYRYSNKLSWSNDGGTDTSFDRPFYFSAFVKHEYIQVKMPSAPPGDEQYFFDQEQFSHFIQGVNLRSDPHRFISFDGRASYTFGGYNDQDVSITGGVNLGRLSDDHRFRFGAGFLEQQPAYFYNRFQSNYVSWQNDFSKPRVLHLQFQYHRRNVSIRSDYYRLNRPVYFDTNAYPAQHSGSFPVLTTRLTVRTDIGVFRGRHSLLFQHIDERNYLRYPAWSSHHSLYAAFSLFDDNLRAHAGLELRYHNPYEPMAYMPVSRQFFPQEGYMSHHTFLVDGFVNARISRARIFVKLRHIAGLLFDQAPVYDIAHYPLPPTQFSFGISWLFFD